MDQQPEISHIPSSVQEFKKVLVTIHRIVGSQENQLLIPYVDEIIKKLLAMFESEDDDAHYTAIVELAHLSGDPLYLETLFSTFIHSTAEKTQLFCKEEENSKTSVVSVALQLIMDDKYDLVRPYGGAILSNLAREEAHLPLLFQRLINPREILAATVDRIDDKKDEVLANALVNITQVGCFSSLIADPEENHMRKLLVHLGSDSSVLMKRAVFGVINNVLFDYETHKWLMDPNGIDLLPLLLLPLAGGEEFDEEDTAKLPLDLQYLPADKERDPDMQIRAMALSSIYQLCTTDEIREFMRECNVYLILREYFNWEENCACVDSCMEIINVLIRTEEEIGVKNLRMVEIPQDLVERFERTSQTD